MRAQANLTFDFGDFHFEGSMDVGTAGLCIVSLDHLCVCDVCAVFFSFLLALKISF